MSKKAGIYKIVNKLNGKFYIGSSCDINQRWRHHKRHLITGKHGNRHMLRTFQKHLNAGLTSDEIFSSVFNFIYLEEEKDYGKRMKLEQNYLDKFYDGGKTCYNMEKIVRKEFYQIKKHTVNKLSSLLKERWKDNEFRKRMALLREEGKFREKNSLRLKLRWTDLNFRKKMSEMSKMRWANPEMREKMISRIKEVKSTNEHREKSSRISKEVFKNQLSRQKLSESMKKLWSNSNSRRKETSERTKRMWRTTVYRELMKKVSQKIANNKETQKRKSELLKEKWRDPVFKEKISSSLKKTYENQELRNKIGKISKSNWQSKEFIDKRAASQRIACQKQSFKEKMSKKSKDFWKNEENRKMMTSKEALEKRIESALKNGTRKIITVISESGEIFQIKNVSEWCKKMGLSDKKFSKLKLGKISSYEGYKIYTDNINEDKNKISDNPK